MYGRVPIRTRPIFNEKHVGLRRKKKGGNGRRKFFLPLSPASFKLVSHRLFITVESEEKTAKWL